MKKEIKRKCQGCAKLINRDELIKITKISNDTIKINPTQYELGRSVYVCKNSQCIETFIKKKKLKTALKFSNNNESLRIYEEIKKLI